MAIAKPTILFEDDAIIVCVKPSGIASQSAKSFQPDMTDILRQHIVTSTGKKGEPYIGVIHRLDQPVGGVIVYAKTPAAAAFLSKQTAEHSMCKKYYAVLVGNIPDTQGTLTDFLLKDSKTNTSAVVSETTKDSKKAVLDYRILETISLDSAKLLSVKAVPSIADNTAQNSDITNLSLADITLHTGRHHQIRVQFANAGCPLLDDNKYNKKQTKRVATLGLFSYSLTFIHPLSKKEVSFECAPDYAPFTWFSTL